MTERQWLRHGVIWRSPLGRITNGHATSPTPTVLGEGIIRVFTSCVDRDYRARPFYFDVDVARRAPRIVHSGSEPVLDVGGSNSFDADGIMCTSVRQVGGTMVMFYSGFKRGAAKRYRISIGAAVSEDGGRSFSRTGSGPILGSSHGKFLIRGGPFVFPTPDGYSMVYAAGYSSRVINGSVRPTYGLMLTQSRDVLNWDTEGFPLVHPSDRFFAYGRPWLFPQGGASYNLLASVRDAEAARYRMAELTFSEDWNLVNTTLGIGLEPTGNATERHETVFGATIEVLGRTWCFYNGDAYGANGVQLAELASND